MKNIFLYALSLTVVFWSCDSEDELIEERFAENPLETPATVTASAGSANFSNYVAIGNSLTAGFMDGALYTRGQENSFPNLLASKFALAGGGEFNQPDINAANGFNTSFNNISTDAFDGPATFGKLVLDLSIPGPVPTTPGDVMSTIPSAERASINNLGVPGMRLIEINAPQLGFYPGGNPFFNRFALDPGNTSVLMQAIAKQPTFISFWLGNNDALAWASSGGVGPDGQDNSGNPNGNDPTPNALVSEFSFNQALRGSLQALFGTFPDLQGVILNVPNVTVTPFFQAVKWNAIPLDAATATATSTAYEGYNDFINLLSNPAGPFGQALSADEAALRQISFVEGNNAVVITDDQLTDITPYVEGAFAGGQISEAEKDALLNLKQARQMKSAQSIPSLAQFGLPAEILTLPSGAVLGTLEDPNSPQSVIGVGVPLGDQYTLTVDEISKLLQRITAFNTFIASEAAEYDNLHLVDANNIITSAAINGYTAPNGFTYQPDFSPNGIYSTDGIHPNPAGHAILANEIMNVIEAQFGSSLPKFEPTDFTTVISAQ